MTGAELARAAEALVGTKFRLHGRDPAMGLDCIGVLAAALAACGQEVALPNYYPWRARQLPELAEVVAECGFVAFDGIILPGDVMMVRIGPCQFHLLIAVTADRFVYAHAGLRRVICCDGPLEWPVVGHWQVSAALS